MKKTSDSNNNGIKTIALGNLDSRVIFLVHFVIDGKFKYILEFQVNHLKVGFSLPHDKPEVSSELKKSRVGEEIINRLFNGGKIDQSFIRKKIVNKDVIFYLLNFFILFQEVADIHKSNINQSYGICVLLDLNNPLNTTFLEIPPKKIPPSDSVFPTKE